VVDMYGVTEQFPSSVFTQPEFSDLSLETGITLKNAVSWDDAPRGSCKN
jgi:hypothetical protein